MADIYGAGGPHHCGALCDAKIRVIKDDITFLLSGVQDLVNIIDGFNVPDIVVMACEKKYELMLNLYKIKLVAIIDLRVVLDCGKGIKGHNSREFLLIGDQFSAGGMLAAHGGGDVATFRPLAGTKQHTPAKKTCNMNKIIKKVAISSSKKSKQQGNKSQMMAGTFKDGIFSISSGYEVQDGKDLNRKATSEDKNGKAYPSSPKLAALIASNSSATTPKSGAPKRKSPTRKYTTAHPTAASGRPRRDGFNLPK